MGDLWKDIEGKPRLLIVEDNMEMRYYLKEILGEKLAITEAGNGMEALDLLKQFTPDLIISDVMMPGMDGQEFITRLKSSESWNKIPVIMLTALAAKEDQLKMLAIGVDDYIVKPFNAEELKIRVYNLLQNQAIRRKWQEMPVEAPEEQVAEDAEAALLQGKIYEYVSVRMKEPSLSVHDLATHLALSERQLYRLTNTLTGVRPPSSSKKCA